MFPPKGKNLLPLEKKDQHVLSECFPFYSRPLYYHCEFIVRFNELEATRNVSFISIVEYLQMYLEPISFCCSYDKFSIRLLDTLSRFVAMF